MGIFPAQWKKYIPLTIHLTLILIGLIYLSVKDSDFSKSFRRETSVGYSISTLLLLFVTLTLMLCASLKSPGIVKRNQTLIIEETFELSPSNTELTNKDSFSVSIHNMDTLNETLLRSSLNYSTEEPKFNKDRNETVEKRLFNGNKYSKLQSVDTSSDDNEEQRIGSNGAEDQAVSQSRHICKTCNLLQPLRAKHCKYCGYCIYKYDHHCPWLGTCIGENNHPYFVSFLFFHVILSSIAVQCILSTYVSGIDDGFSEWLKSNGLAVLFVILLIISILVMGFLFISHFYLISKGFSTWEFLSRSKISYLKLYRENTLKFIEQYKKDKGESRTNPAKRLKLNLTEEDFATLELKSPFDVGFFSNWKIFFFGKKPRLWDINESFPVYK